MVVAVIIFVVPIGFPHDDLKDNEFIRRVLALKPSKEVAYDELCEDSFELSEISKNLVREYLHI